LSITSISVQVLPQGPATLDDVLFSDLQTCVDASLQMAREPITANVKEHCSMVRDFSSGWEILNHF